MKSIDELDFMISVKHYKPVPQNYNVTEMRLKLEDKAKQELRAIIEEIVDRVIGSSEWREGDGEEALKAGLSVTVGQIQRDISLRDEQRTTAKEELDKLFKTA